MLSNFYNTLRQQANSGKLYAEIQDEALSYQALINQIERTVGFLRAQALPEKSKVIIATKDWKSFLVLALSCFFEGLTSILLPPDTKLDKLKYFTQLTNTQLLFLDNENFETYQNSLTCPIVAVDVRKEKQAFIKKILGSESSSAALTYPKLLKNFLPVTPHLRSAPEDLALIVFTSGSTATPKGVMLSYRNILSHLKTLKKVFSYDEQSVIFNNLPLYHMDGLIQGAIIVGFCGAKLIAPEKFSLQNLDALLNKVIAKNVSHIIIVPSILALLDRYAIHDDYFQGLNFKGIVSTAAYLNADIWRRLQDRFKVNIYNVYGLIETVVGGIFCGPDPASFEIGTVGLPVDMQAKIVNESFEEISHEVGELLLRGENVSQGYIGSASYNMPMMKDGWLCTGDFARKKPNGLIEIIGRKKEVIISNGITIYPEEINEILLKHPDIKSAASFGIEDHFSGEALVVAIETSIPMIKADLLDFCNQYLEEEKKPKHFIFVKAIPRGPAGKPLLPLLKEMAEENLKLGANTLNHVKQDDVIALAAEVFQIAVTSMSIHSTPRNVIGWDSLGHIRLMEAAERRFQIRYRMSDIIQVGSLLDLYERTQQLL